MPSKKQIAASEEVKKLFAQITLNSRPAWICLVPKCNKVYRSSQISVRKRHLHDNHSNVIKSILKKVNQQFELESESSDDDNTIRVKINKKRVINACVEMVTKNGLPFSMMSGSGFVQILNPILDGLGNTNKQVSINRNNIKGHLQDKVDDTVERIKREVKGSFVSLMMDMATRQSRSILGISVQWTMVL